MTAPRPTGSIDIWNFVDNVTGVTVRKWLRDSWARHKIVALQQAVAAIVVPTRTSQLTNDSGFITQADIPPGSTASTTTPKMDGTAAVGTENAFARGDHRHPSDTNKADKATTLAGYGITNAYTKTEVNNLIPTVPTNVSAFTNDAGYVTASAVPDASSATPAMDGTGAAGSSADYARADHVHPHDTSKQDALTAAQLAAVNSGITADNLAVNNASVLCAITPISPTLRAGTNYASYGNCFYYKEGHRVTVHIGVSGLTANTRTTLWYMPTGYRPKAPVSAVGIAQDIMYRSMVRISESGGTVSVYSEGTYALIEVSYDAYQ